MSNRQFLVCGIALLSAQVHAQYRDLNERLSHVRTGQEAASVVFQSPAADDPDLLRVLAKTTRSPQEVLREVRAVVDMKAMAEGAQASSVSESIVRQVKQPAVYRDPGPREESGWFQRAISTLKNLIPHWNFDPKPAGGFGWLAFLKYALWGLIVVGVLAVAILAVRSLAGLKRPTKSRRGALVDAEPDRTLDEWLTLAEDFERQGRHREAVRALYVACLLRLDEAGVARFVRGETNWEHLARIEASPTRPADLDFREPTRRFDHAWYGMRATGSEDVDRLRRAYLRLTDSLPRRAA